jgi:hypothetical protein
MIRNFVDAVEMIGLDSAAMLAGYQPIDADGLTYPCFYVRVINASNEDVTISYDGVEDHDYLPAGETLTLPLQSHSQPSNYVAQMKAGAKVYVKGTAGAGNIYLSGYFL